MPFWNINNGHCIAFDFSDAEVKYGAAELPGVFDCLLQAAMIDQQTAEHAAMIQAQSGLGMWPCCITGLPFISLCAPTASITYSMIMAKYTTDLHQERHEKSP